MPRKGAIRRDLTGQTFGRLTVVALSHRNSRRVAMWSCRCACGETVTIAHDNILSGRSQSCGCFRSEVTAARSERHGHDRRGERSPEYESWVAMHSRVRSTDDRSKAHGARGIKICARWDSFENFLADMGPRPPGTTIDRKDNDGDYEPGNCRWATDAEQARNRSDNRRLTFNGRTQTLADWSAELGINRSTVDSRLQRGWSVEKALTTAPGEAA